jgi:sugar-specific transcriptional regulator TrmB
MTKKQLNPELRHWLVEAGLDEQRASIYLAVLARTECRAAEIAEDLGMNRTAMYDNLAFLEGRGFVTRYKKGSGTFFKALQPRELESRYKNQFNRLQDLMPHFLSLAGGALAQPTIERFRGDYAARHIFEDILSKKPAEYCYISNPVETYKIVSRKYITRWIHQRVQLKIRARGIRTLRLESPADRIFTEEKSFLRKLKYLPSALTFGATLYIYGSSVGLISSYREGEALIINSNDISTTFQQFFEILWGVSHN